MSALGVSLLTPPHDRFISCGRDAETRGCAMAKLAASLYLLSLSLLLSSSLSSRTGLEPHRVSDSVCEKV